MNGMDVQTKYWDAVAATKTFAHPVPMQTFLDSVPVDARILDYGCGYGRTCSEFVTNGYRHVVGVDISAGMIARGGTLFPNLDLRRFDGSSLPFADDMFDICTLLAVLTCIPTDAGQRAVMSEIRRVLRPGGILYVSDYPLQPDSRNQDRYQEFKDEFGVFGVFRLPDGGIVRHHDRRWVHELLSPFDVLNEGSAEVHTMNGNAARIFQIMARKR